MDIAIIGGGFTGLTAAYELSKKGHTVTLFEKEKTLGGLAYGFKEKNWSWYVEGAYHHLFTNDVHILNLCRKLNVSVITTRPVTSTLWHEHMYQLDSPLHLLAFPGLSIVDKIRTGGAIAFLKLFSFWKLLEYVTAERFLITIGGKNAWKTIWEPLLYGKFGMYAPGVAASWFWARIVKRTPSLYYIKGGFHTLVIALEKAILSHGGIILTSTSVKSITKESRGTYQVSWKNNKKLFEKILITIPTFLTAKLTSLIPDSYTKPLLSIHHLYTQTLIVETDRPILKNVYWLNVTDRSFPFLAAVAHTNFMDPKHYGGRHLTYFGNYLPQGHRYVSMSKEQLLKEFQPFIRRLSHNTKYEIRNTYLFTAPFAQPVHQLHYSQKIPPIQTPIPGIYLANMDYVVPWDRGTNYAVELGLRAARVMSSI